MKALKKIKPQDLAITKPQGSRKSGASKDYIINAGKDPRRDNAFKRLLEDLTSKVLAAKDHRIWQSETVFITLIGGDSMLLTVRSGALIWVDISQKPRPTGGIVEGDMYLLQNTVKTKTKPMTWTVLKRVCIWYKDGIWGREYYTDREESKGGAARYVATFHNQEDHIEDNKRYVGRVIGTLNPI